MIKFANAELASALRREAAEAVQGSWLVIMPGSGRVLRYKGSLLFVELGGEAKGIPFIANEKGAIALDPRCLIVEEETLACVYHPRQMLDRVHAMAGKWYADNPDVFNSNIPDELPTPT